MIYFDAAATSLQRPPEVAQAVLQAMGTFGNGARGTHYFAHNAAMAVYRARVRIARLFHCPRPDHVVFTANVTEALNMAINGLIDPGDRVITTALEHNSVLRPLYRLAAEQGVGVDIVPADKMGRVEYDAFERLIRPDTRAIVCTHASNLTGNMVDLKLVREIARRHGLLFIVDAAQTAGSVPIDAVSSGVDVLCFTGHKGLLGPQGTGGLCLCSEAAEKMRPLKAGGTGSGSFSRTQPEDLPARLEAGTLNSHGIAGLSAGIDFIERVGIGNIREKELLLMRRFYEGVRDIPGIRIYGDFDAPRTAIVALNMGEWDAGKVADVLSEEYGIATRAGAHCAPLMHGALGTERQGVVRFSFSFFNTEEEIGQGIAALREISCREG